jgi:copper transport protein
MVRSGASASRRRGRVLRLAGVLALSSLATLFVAGTAGAHADLVSTDPAGGSNLTTAPRAITLSFTEGVDVRSDGIRLLNDRGDDLEVGRPTHPDGQSAVVRVTVPDLDDGLYAVVWRAVSADAHPIAGTFTFGVGTEGSGAAADALVAKANVATASDELVGLLFGVARFLVFAGLAALLGGVAFLATLWPGDRDTPAVRRLLVAALLVTAGATVLGFLLQGSYTSGGTIADLFAGDQISAVWDTRFGKVWVLRLVLLVVAAGLIRFMVRHRGALPAWWFDAAGVTGLALAATPGLAGHASTGRWVVLALPADALHVFAMALWLGGLLMLVLARARDGFDRAAWRFSGVAFVAVATVVVTGSFQAVRQVPAISDLWDTEYGRILLVKLSVFAALLVLAAWSRRLVHGSGRFWQFGGEAPAGQPVEIPVVATAEPDGAVATLVAPPENPPAPPRVPSGNVVRSVVFELLLGAAILGLTAGLVNTPPPEATPTSVGIQTVLGDGEVRLDTQFLPARAGEDNELHLTAVGADGLPVEIVEMQASLTNEARGVPPIDVPLTGISTGHYIGEGVTVPFPGEWQLAVTVFVTDVEPVEFSTPVTVG